MTASSALLLLLVVACPLMMMLMMRGGHGSGQGDHASRHSGNTGPGRGSDYSIDELRRQRDELDRLIDERERAEERELEPTAGGNR
jgi:hypothetical protein